GLIDKRDGGPNPRASVELETRRRVRRNASAQTIDRSTGAKTDTKRSSASVLNQALALAIQRPAVLFQKAAVQQKLHQRKRNESRALPAHFGRGSGRPNPLRRNHKPGLALKRKARAEPYRGAAGAACRGVEPL